MFGKPKSRFPIFGKPKSRVPVFKRVDIKNFNATDLSAIIIVILCADKFNCTVKTGQS